MGPEDFRLCLLAGTLSLLSMVSQVFYCKYHVKQQVEEAQTGITKRDPGIALPTNYCSRLARELADAAELARANHRRLAHPGAPAGNDGRVGKVVLEVLGS